MNSYYWPQSFRLAPYLRNQAKRLLFVPFILIASFVACLALHSNIGFAAENPAARGAEKQIIIPPFKVQTKHPQPYLQTGLANILATRITKKTGYIVASHSPTTDMLTDLLAQQNYIRVQKILQKMDNTYLLAGVLREKQQGYEMTIHVFEHRPKAQISLSQKFQRLDRALSTVDELAVNIAEKVFSISRPTKDQVIPASNGFEEFHTAHPERIFKDKKFGANITQPKVKDNAFSKPSSGMSSSGGISSSEMSSSKKYILPSSSTPLAIAVGDLNNDGKDEVIILERATLALYHTGPNASLQRIAFQPLASHLALHTVYLADLDHNGLQEIYIGASNGTLPASQILEWNGKIFRVLSQNAPYYLRPGMNTQGQPALLGQENVFQKTRSNVLYSLRRGRNGSLQKIQRITLPFGFTIYDFIQVDLDLDGNLEFVGINHNNRLVVINNRGRVVWKSEKNYGARREILGALSRTIDGDRHQANNPESIYMHSRILVQDLNNDGKPELLLGQNRLTNVMFFKRLRSFDGSSVTALSWDNGKMKTLWESPKISEYTIDFQILQDKKERNRFNIFSLAQEHNSSVIPFWGSKESLVQTYTLEGLGEKR
ncbi:MAG: VCBS repeat-containing protein [Candidatus Electrothrix sp. AW1]|nr:VCBS repeat-containing protein [Candidatus Electrothrix sp. AX1]MCI5181845.1 VCBS repeat-containing protein [Candidatus Electrothrix gigas]